jgi:hypothetical protein
VSTVVSRAECAGCRDLRARVEVLEARSAVAPASPAPKRQELDVALVGALLRAGLRGVVRATVAFAAGERNPALRTALTNCLIDDAKTLGLTFTRLAKRGLVERLARDRYGARWRLRDSVTTGTATVTGRHTGEP